MFDCCAHDADKRPTFAGVKGTITRVLAEYEEARSQHRPDAPQRFTTATFANPDCCPADLVVWTADSGLAPQQLVACARRDYSVDVWNLAKQELQCTLVGHLDRVTDVAFCRCACPESGCRRFTIATVSEDASVRLWNAETGEELSLLMGHETPATSVACLRGPNSTSYVVSVSESELNVWTPAASLHAACSRRMDDGVVALAVAAAPSAGCMHVLACTAMARGHQFFLLALKLGSDCHCVNSMRDRRELDLGRAQKFDHTCYAFSNDGLSVAVGFANNTVIIFGTMNEAPVTVDLAATPLSCGFSSLRGLMSVALSDGRVQLLDLGMQTTVLTLAGDGAEMLCAAPDYQGRGVAVGSQDGTVRVMDSWDI